MRGDIRICGDDIYLGHASVLIKIMVRPLKYNIEADKADGAAVAIGLFLSLEMENKKLLTYAYMRCIYKYIQLINRIYTVAKMRRIIMLIELKGVSKQLGTFKLKDISMELPKGYICGLIGPNGAGKTTLLHLILGLYRENAGEIRIDGQSYEEAEREIHDMIGTVLQEELFDGALTLGQNGDEYGSYYQSYRREILEEYLGRFGLDANRTYKKLSKGEKLKFQFAFALSHDAKLLILDEPTGNFDVSFREEFFKVLKEFIADGQRSVVLATHLTEDLDRVADYICYLEKGQIIFTGDIEELHDTYRLVTGEEYKVKLLRREDIIHMENGQYGTKALVKYRPRCVYDSLVVTVPTIEELMYFMTKRGKK